MQPMALYTLYGWQFCVGAVGQAHSLCAWCHNASLQLSSAKIIALVKFSFRQAFLIPLGRYYTTAKRAVLAVNGDGIVSFGIACVQ